MAQRNRQGRLATSLALVGTLAGVLIWQKLRLSTNMPRAAYAIPRDDADSKSTQPENVLVIEEITAISGKVGGVGSEKTAEPSVTETAKPEPVSGESDAAEEPEHDS